MFGKHAVVIFVEYIYFIFFFGLFSGFSSQNVARNVIQSPKGKKRGVLLIPRGKGQGLLISILKQIKFKRFSEEHQNASKIDTEFRINLRSYCS